VTTILFKTIYHLLSLLPLRVLHWLGALLGQLIYALSPSYAARMRENLQQAGFTLDDDAGRRLLSAAIAEAGKGIMELPWVWGRSYEEVLGSVVACHGWEHVAEAHAQGKGVVLLTPHLGCFEMVAQHASSRLPMTSMYRPPKLRWLEAVMCNGRARGLGKLAKADMSGVRLLLKALKRGEIIGMLPDQTPSQGEGEWVDFFGRPAYTMTLLGKLVQSTKSHVVMCQSVRLPKGAGYELHFSSLDLDVTASIPEQVNAAMEQLIRAYPEQYLWSYNRYKVPNGVQPPGSQPLVAGGES